MSTTSKEANIIKTAERWRKYPGCEEDKVDIKTLDSNGHAYRMLKTCAMLNGCTVEEVIEYLLNNTEPHSRDFSRELGDILAV